MDVRLHSLCNKEVCEFARNEALSGGAGTAEDDATTLTQHGDVAQQEGLGDERLEGERVDAIVTRITQLHRHVGRVTHEISARKQLGDARICLKTTHQHYTMFVIQAVTVIHTCFGFSPFKRVTWSPMW